MQKQEQRVIDHWELRKGGKTIVYSSLKNCGYPASDLRAMQRDGIYLYRNGERVKAP